MASFQETFGFDDDKEQVQEAVEEIVTNVIRVHVECDRNPTLVANTNIEGKLFPHLAHNDEVDKTARFTARL